MEFYYVTISTKGWKTLDRIFNDLDHAKIYANYLISIYTDKYTIRLRKTGNFGDVFEAEEYTIKESKGTYKKEGRQ